MPVPLLYKEWYLGVVGLLIATIGLIGLVSTNSVVDLSLEKAHYETENWIGREVRMVGWLRRFEGDTGTHFGLEDAKQNRIAVREYDTALLELYVNRRLELEGKLYYNQQYGIYLIPKKSRVLGNAVSNP